MKTLPIILVILIFTFELKCQDYQTVVSNRTAYFERGNIKCLRIDSVEIQSDSIFFPAINIQQIDFDCFNPFGPSWIGRKLIIKNSGINLFINTNFDTIIIKTNARLNDSWLAFKTEDSLKVIASVLKHDTCSFLGITDSVKTIGFQVFNDTTLAISHVLNDYTILISKTYGLIRTLNFLLFPDIESNYFLGEQINEYELVGLSNPKVGVQNLEWFDVYDFQVGDEIHDIHTDITFGPGCIYFDKKIETIKKYLSRSDYNDSIIFMVERFQRITKNWSDSSNHEFFHDTINQTIRINPDFDQFPQEPVINENSFYFYEMGIGPEVWKSVDLISLRFEYSSDTCWQLPIFDGCLGSSKYIKGLGGPYHSCTGGLMCYDATTEEPVYYLKGTSEWGTPFTFTSIFNKEVESDILIFPNPATDQIWIKCPANTDPVLIELVDLSGIVVYSEFVSNLPYSIHLTNLPRGLYICRIMNDNIIYKGKLIIK